MTLLVAEPMMDFGESPNGREVFGRELQDELELLLRFLETPELHERAAQRHVGG